jgi:hypothetical protein
LEVLGPSLLVHRAIPGSKMIALEGVGHDLPPGPAARVLKSVIAQALGARR